MALTFSNKTVLRLLKAQIEEALAPIAAQHGISIQCGSGSYTNDSFTVKLECANLGESGEAVPKHRADFMVAHIRKMFGLEEGDLGARFTYGGKEYQFDGLMPNRPKYPVAAKRVSDGKIHVLEDKAIAKIVAARTSRAAS